MQTLLETIHAEHTKAIDGMFRDCSESLTKLAARCVSAFAQNHKLFFCGNGGSACDAAHIAGEFVGRFVHDRRALPAIALTADAGILTAVANDYSYEDVFSRQIEALGAAGDVLIAMSNLAPHQLPVFRPTGYRYQYVCVLFFFFRNANANASCTLLITMQITNYQFVWGFVHFIW